VAERLFNPARAASTHSKPAQTGPAHTEPEPEGRPEATGQA
jgi:hypothetical protein